MRVFFVVLACCFFATLVCAGQPVCVGETNNKLFSDLNSNVYVIRNSASRKLEQKMDFSLYLKLRDGKPGNAEYSHRFKYLVRVFEQKTREKYQPDLCGHPDYPWIFFNPNRPYAWRGLNHNDLYETYVLLVNKRGVCGTNANDWLDYRLATKIWLDERITLACSEAFAARTTEKEFSVCMDAQMRSIRKDILLMIEGEERWCASNNHPLLRHAKAKKMSVVPKPVPDD